MGTKYATDALFIEASTIGDATSLDEETRVRCDLPRPIDPVPVQTEEGKEPVPPRPLPRFRRYSLSHEPVEVDSDRPYWRLVTIMAPALPAAVEVAYDRLFRDPDVADLVTNLVRIPVGPAQSLFARIKPGAAGPVVLSIISDPWLDRR